MSTKIEDGGVSNVGVELMQHATGWPKNYRNYFAAEPCGAYAAEWEKLIESGHAKRGRIINQPPNELQIYHVTEAGCTLLQARSPTGEQAP